MEGTRSNTIEAQIVEIDTVIKANCWFLVSFIYECLDEIFYGSIVAQFLYLRRGSEEIRQSMKAAARLIVNFPFEPAVCIVLLTFGT